MVSGRARTHVGVEENHSSSLLRRCLSSNLRWTRGEDGVYAKALQELENKRTVDDETHEVTPRYPSDTIEKWRQALSDAADINGFELAKYKGDRHQLVEAVVEEVLSKVKRPVHVSKHPIGLDQKVRDFEKTVSLQPQSRETRVIGIVGLGGVGKTTLAQEIFNRQQSKYDRSCRLSDVRGTDLKSSQSKLLADLARWNGKIDDIDDGIGKIKDYLRRDPPTLALLIIDDVDDINQLNALLEPVKDNVKSGSLILVTSRNEDVLTSCKIVRSSIYKLKGLNLQHSRELFCWHAFGQSHPLEKFARLVDGFLKACDGLPLSLEVIGALLCGKDDLRDWEEQLSEVSKSSPDDIKSRLKISFDGLNEQEKKIFLDVACFFIGEDVNTAVRIWIASGWSGWLGLRKLENRCLAEVDSESCIRMHDHLRDLGRDLAEKETPHRIWHQTDTLVQELSGQSPVRGISLVQRYGSEWSDPQLFKTLAAEDQGSQLIENMSSLQLLRAEGDCVESIFKISGSQKALFSPNLVWLCWHSYPFPFLPPWIPLNKLTVLEITGNNLETLWEDVSQAPLQLRELIINVASLLKIPKSIEKLERLEKIVLHLNEGEHTVDLETLPDEFCHLQCLEHLELTSCSKLKSLPYSFGNLRNLRHLDLSGCSNLEMLPVSFGELRKLQYINLSKCSNLDMLPYFVGNLRNLRHINLSECSNLQLLPNSLENFKKLQHIDLSGCSKLQILPSFFGNIRNLRHIDLSRCHNLHLGDSLLMSGLELVTVAGDCLDERTFGSVQSQHLMWLRWDGCPYSCLPSWIPMDRLGILQVGGHTALKTLWELHEAPLQLRELIINVASLLKIPKSIEKLERLEKFVLHPNEGEHTVDLETLPDEFCHLQCLEHLELTSCSKLKSLPYSFGNLRNLRHLDLSGCSNLEMLPVSFGELRKLQHINLSKCSNLDMLPYFVGNLRNVRHINLSECSNLQLLPNSLENLKKLRYIDLSGCSKLQILPNFFGNIRNLRHIDLSRCHNLQMLPNSFGKLTNLQHIDLSSCSSLPILPNSFGNLIQLKYLCLRNCYDLSIYTETLGKIRTLEWIEISGCYGIESLPPQVAHQPFLREMYLFCPYLKELPIATGKLSNLEILHLGSSCLELLEIETLVSLKELSTRECVKLKSIKGLVQLTKLRRLDVASCSELEQLEGVEHLSSLEELNASGCLKLKSIQGLVQLTKLRRLDVGNCSELEQLEGVEHLSSLEELNASGCLKLKSIQGLVQLTKLRRLDVGNCSKLEQLEGVEHLSSLEELNASECPKLKWGREVLKQLRQELKERITI